MAVRISMEWPGITPEQYDTVCELAAWEVDAPEGGIFHVASFVDGVLQVTDAWDTPEHFMAFVGARLMPAVAGAGIVADPPSPTVEPMFEFLSGNTETPSPVLEEVIFPGVTEAEWTALRAEVGWVETNPIGGRAHMSVVRPDGISVINVWRSVDDQKAFEADRVIPAMMRLGAEAGAPPVQSFRPAYRYFDASRTRVS